jgi:hypothetical protein
MTPDRRSHPVPNDIVMTREVAEYLGGGDWADVVSNSDYRRYDDVLRLTLNARPTRSKWSRSYLSGPEIVEMSGLACTGKPMPL